MSYFELCLKFEEMIKKGIDISTLSEFQTFAKAYPHTAKKLLLEAEIIKLKQSIEGKRMREKFLTHMKIDKLKDERARLVLKEKAYWNYRMEYTKYSISKLKTSTVSIIKGGTSLIKSLILGTKQRVKNSLPISLSYAGTWALTSRHITEWNRNRVYSILKKCREKARSHRRRYSKLYAKLRGGSS